MMQPTLHSTPRPRDVLREQLRVTGSALRLPFLVPAVLLVLAALLVAGLTDARSPADFHPESQMLPGMLGLVLPIAVWRGERHFGAGFLWTLPVDRRRHALAKVFAGWAWLISLVAIFVLWLLAYTLVTGGKVQPVEALWILPPRPFPAHGLVDPATLRTVHWTPEPLFWLVPFTAATGTYLLASAAVLGLRHPLWWIVGIGIAIVALDGVGALAHAPWLRMAPGRVLEPLFYGPYGFDALLTARIQSIRTEATLATGESVVVWRTMPDLRLWVVATLLWTGGGLAALWAAASRHGERRPA
ncbi:MAG: hypothetical protein JO040_09160 [Gemmatimonadetes bacterium]|nr:hypothetical protein [Gemmatimonadota bacterium]